MVPPQQLLNENRRAPQNDSVEPRIVKIGAEMAKQQQVKVQVRQTGSQAKEKVRTPPPDIARTEQKQ